MLFFERGAPDMVLDDKDLKDGLFEALNKIGRRSKVLAIPPDITRFHSRAGLLTQHAYEYFGDRLTDILPALGTHSPMTPEELDEMFAGVPHSLFREHKWKTDLSTLGIVPGSYVKEVSQGKLDFDWPAQVNSLLTQGGFDLILSIGQVVPHEVIGMANYNKNLFVGTGGSEGINKSHFLGAVYGMEKIMGRADNPVRQVLNYASEHFAGELPVIYVQTVVARGPDGDLVTRGLYIGDDVECFSKAAELSLEVNFTMLDEPIRKAVVYLDPSEFRSTWLGNKSIYRTRMALADEGELVVIAPGVKEFGEDSGIDALIRKYGYVGSDRVLDLTSKNEDLQASLGA
ncbi:MAG: lactate racemase domain-containing protein, partial [Desulfobacterales bacterium]|nr:lactate racemase domain-containing protein [Desulfobacterales bacterium]